MRSRVIAGAKVICYINGQVFARVTGFAFSIDTPIKEIRGLDSPIPYELAVTHGRCVFTMNLVRTIGDGGAEGSGMSAPFEDIANQKYFSVMLIERSSDTVLFQADFCMAQSQSWDAPAKGLMSGRLAATALSYNNEVRPVHQ